MQEVQPGWWMTRLKDKTTNLYARVDVVKKNDGGLVISIGIAKLFAKILIEFDDGELSMALVRNPGGEDERVWKETMKIDGEFIWKEEDSSNQG